MIEKASTSGQQYGLIVHDDDKVSRFLARYLNLIINYHYGLPIRTAPDLSHGQSDIGRGMRCAFVIQGREIENRTTIQAFSQQGQTPLFLVFPASLITQHQKLCGGFDKVFLCSWEEAFAETNSLQKTVETSLANDGVPSLFSEVHKVPHEVLQPKLKSWLQNLDTLPTLPEIVLRIMAMTNDPATTIEDLEGLLLSDAAIVHKLLQVVNSPAFAGSGRKSEWELKDAIVRLGLKKVSAIAQQIKLINSFTRPAESGFDLRRYWEHSIGCALVADKLYSRKLLKLSERIEFNEYWIATLLHDAGKLVLGFFFWDWFDRVVRRMQWTLLPFRKTEAQMGDGANHEQIGQLLLLAAGMGPEVALSVGNHHTVGKSPSDLTCLLHMANMANNLCRDLGLGYFADERGVYSQSVLRKLELEKEDLQTLKDELGTEVVDEIKELVNQCV